ncbi:hypothetical protein BV898_13165 [Hypsibius exemplaris]|uniref:Receptor ligand binding region domain-containing protein n=1 Tax=Hypsibius exemplaris TaxID=2072580 RepID=A0A1W0WBR3_HYPEX|nr:hypothetical protein BV898_13165 [Hypsibius exemplaris]
MISRTWYFIFGLILRVGSEEMDPRKIRTINIATPGSISLSSVTSLAFIAPAVESAVGDLQDKYSGIFNWTHSIIYNRSLTNYGDYGDSVDELAASWYYTRRVPADLTVFIFAGGQQEVDAINRLSAGWNTLMITSAATLPAQRNKRLSPTWLATGCCGVSNFAKTYLYLMRTNNWTSVYQVVDAASLMTPLVAQVLSDAIAKMEGIQHTIFTIPPGSRTRETYDILLREFNTSSRVLFFFGHSHSFKGLMRQAGQLLMLTNEYIYVTLEPFLNLVMFGNLSAVDDGDQILQTAYRSVIVVGIADFINHPGPEATNQIPEWKDLSSIEFNYTYKPNEQISPHVTSTYYSVLLLAEILNETLSADPHFDLRDGSALARRFFNRTVKIDDLPVYVDEVGERRTNGEIRQFNNETGKFEVIMIQSGATGQVTQVRPINWHGRSQFPANEPLCGYSGNSPRCMRAAETETIKNVVVGPEDVAVDEDTILDGIEALGKELCLRPATLQKLEEAGFGTKEDVKLMSAEEVVGLGIVLYDVLKIKKWMTPISEAISGLTVKVANLHPSASTSRAAKVARAPSQQQRMPSHRSSINLQNKSESEFELETDHALTFQKHARNLKRPHGLVLKRFVS